MTLILTVSRYHLLSFYSIYFAILKISSRSNAIWICINATQQWTACWPQTWHNKRPPLAPVWSVSVLGTWGKNKFKYRESGNFLCLNFSINIVPDASAVVIPGKQLFAVFMSSQSQLFWMYSSYIIYMLLLLVESLESDLWSGYTRKII